MSCIIDVYCDAFIPMARLDNPLPATVPFDTTYYHSFAGDNRGFKKGGRARLWSWVLVDVQQGVIISRAHGIGITTGYRYATEKILDIAWYDMTTPAYRVIEVSASAMASDKNMKEEQLAGGLCKITVKLTGAAANPLVSHAPDIDYEHDVTLFGRPSTISYSLNGTHDGFPAHSVYVGSNLIYGYDPRPLGKTPWELWGKGDVPAVRSGVLPANCTCSAPATPNLPGGIAHVTGESLTEGPPHPPRD